MFAEVQRQAVHIRNDLACLLGCQPSESMEKIVRELVRRHIKALPALLALRYLYQPYSTSIRMFDLLCEFVPFKVVNLDLPDIERVLRTRSDLGKTAYFLNITDDFAKVLSQILNKTEPFLLCLQKLLYVFEQMFQLVQKYMTDEFKKPCYRKYYDLNLVIQRTVYRITQTHSS